MKVLVEDKSIDFKIIIIGKSGEDLFLILNDPKSNLRFSLDFPKNRTHLFSAFCNELRKTCTANAVLKEIQQVDPVRTMTQFYKKVGIRKSPKKMRTYYWGINFLYNGHPDLSFGFSDVNDPISRRKDYFSDYFSIMSTHKSKRPDIKIDIPIKIFFKFRAVCLKAQEAIQNQGLLKI